VESNKKVEFLKDKIFYIKDFLFLETCELLVSTFSRDNLRQSEKVGIFGGPGKGEKESFSVSGIEKITASSDEKDINLGIDIFTGVLTNIEKTASNIFNKNLVLKSYFYSHMKKGGKNLLHVDNYEEKYSKDYSAILYLTNSYTGGNVIFPNQELTMKPDPGTLVTFIGSEDVPHEVEEVVDGDRVNIICFLHEKKVD
jgi:hypothetical protein